MSFFKNLFQKDEEPQPFPAESPELTIARQIGAMLQCPVMELPQAEELIDLEDMWDAYLEALERGKQQGFTPVLIICDDLLLEMMEENLPEGQSHVEIPAQLDGKAWLEQMFTQWETELRSIAPEGLQVLTEPVPEKAEAAHRFLSLRMNPLQQAPVLLAEIPTKNPWEVMAWVPFGGWNACPMPEDAMAVLKHWYEKYGAVPGCIGHDTLELYVLHPVGEEAAMELAREQFMFCEDIVYQGVGSVPALAKGLEQSTVWYFWWD
ncbi:MAG: DUF4253 domain-containing protein [Ruminococcus sp.]